MKKIVIHFDNQGGSSIEAFGFTGKDCLAATKSIEEAIGKVAARKDKPEIHMVPARATLKT